MKWIRRIVYAFFIIVYLGILVWMIDKTVAHNQERWERQTQGMTMARPSDSD